MLPQRRSRVSARDEALWRFYFTQIAKTWDSATSKLPINGDFTVSGTAVTLQQIFVIQFRMNFELVFQKWGQKLSPLLFWGNNEKWEKLIEGMHTYKPEEIKLHLANAGFKGIYIQKNETKHWLMATAKK